MRAPLLGSALCGAAARLLGLSSAAICGAAQNSERRPDGTHGRRVLEGSPSATSPARACAQGAVRARHASGRALSVTHLIHVSCSTDTTRRPRCGHELRSDACSGSRLRACASAHSRLSLRRKRFWPWPTSAPRSTRYWRFSSGACCLVSMPAARLRCVAPVRTLRSGSARSGGELGGGLSAGVSQ